MARISLRVSDTLKKACDEVGAERVRQVLSDALLSDVSDAGMSDSTGKVVGQGKVSDKPVVESVRHPLEDEVTESGAPSWPGPYGGEDGGVSDGVPSVPARAAFVVQKAKVFSRTAEEQAERLKKLEGMLGLGSVKDENQEP